MLRKILFGGESGFSRAANAGLALLRIFTGLALAFGHGIGKMPPSKRFIEIVGGLGFPLPTLFAWIASLTEFGGAIFLALGLFTRISGFFVSVFMIVAAFGVHVSDPFDKKEKALLYLFIALLFFFKGSSDWSIDALIRERN